MGTEDQRRDRAQWEEQEEESDDETGGQDDAYSLDDSDEEFLSDSEGDEDDRNGQETESATPNSDDDDAASEAQSTSYTAPSSRSKSGLPGADMTSSIRSKSRATRDSDRDRMSRSRLSMRNVGSRTGASVARSGNRSASRARYASTSHRDLAASTASPEQPFSSANETRSHRGRSDPRRDDSPSRRARNARAFSHYLGYPVDFLAEMLAPRREMCNRKFEFVIDDLAFIGHPVHRKIDDNDFGEEDEDNRGRRHRDGGKPDAAAQVPEPGSPLPDIDRGNHRSRNDEDPVEMFHLVLVIQPPDPSYAAPTLDLTTWLGLWYDNVTFKMTAALWAEEQRATYVSEQSSLLSKSWGHAESQFQGDAGPSYALHLSELLMTSTLARALRQMYRALVRPPSTHSTPFVSLNDSLDVHLQLPPLLTDPARMVKSILELGHSIEAEEAEVWAQDAVEGGDALDVGNAFDEWTRASGPPLYPWKTLLILHDADVDRIKTKRYRSIGGKVVEVESDDESAMALDAALEGGEAYSLADVGIELWARKFTSLLKPTLQGVPTFADLASLLSWDLMSDVYPMARHLVYYKQAKVSDVPRIQNTYSVSPLFDLTSLPRFATSFALRYPDQPPLARLLAVIGSRLQPFMGHYMSVQQLSRHASEPSNRAIEQQRKRTQALDVLVWLLQHDILIQQQLRFRLIATEAVKRRAKETWEAQRAAKAEARCKRDERREWLREKKALRKGADPKSRKGEMLPLVAHSAPGDGPLTTAVRQGSSLAHEAREERGRPRSRSVEARQRATAQQQRGALGDETIGESHDVPRQAAARISPSSSRSRSRHPPPLGRIAASGRIVFERPRSSSSRPSRLEVGAGQPSSGELESRVDALQFERRHVSRSRSPNSTMPPAVGGRASRSHLESDTVPLAAATAASATSDTSAGEKSEQHGVNRTQQTQNRDIARSQRSATIDSQNTSSSGTPRERATQILVAEHQRKRASSMISAHHGSLSTNSSHGRPGANVGTHEAANNNPDSATSGSIGSRQGGRRRGNSVSSSNASGPVRAPLNPPTRQKRSPSAARMQVRGFGNDEEKVFIDGEEVTAGYTSPSQQFDSPAQDHEVVSEPVEEGRRLSLVGEEELEPKANTFEATGDAALQGVADLHPDLSDEEHEDDDDGGQSSQDDGVKDDAAASSFSSSASDSDSGSDASDTSPYLDLTPSLIPDPSRATSIENVWIAAMIDLHRHPEGRAGATTEDSEQDEQDDDEVVQAFFRLLPYLNGKHTIDEVVCREGMRRKGLRTLLGKFKDEIMTFVHP